MREIMEVAKFIRKELKHADEFAYEANKHREQFPDLAQHYHRAANEHLSIADDLHSSATRLIEHHRHTVGSPPAEMLKMWEFEHEMMIDEKECIIRKLSMFK